MICTEPSLPDHQLLKARISWIIQHYIINLHASFDHNNLDCADLSSNIPDFCQDILTFPVSPRPICVTLKDDN